MGSVSPQSRVPGAGSEVAGAGSTCQGAGLFLLLPGGGAGHSCPVRFYLKKKILLPERG